jgi:hypothetical protein
LLIEERQNDRRHYKLGRFRPSDIDRSLFRLGSIFQGRDSLERKAFSHGVAGSGIFWCPGLQGADHLERCIVLEQRAKRIYETLATVFTGPGVASQFFSDLAVQEQSHADFLNICRAASLFRTGWNGKLFNPWHEYLPRIEEQMEEAEAEVQQVDSLGVALRLVLRIESSEINEVFYAAMAATDAAFETRFKPFRQAMNVHMAYIADTIPRLCPQLTFACRTLQTRYSRAA